MSDDGPVPETLTKPSPLGNPPPRHGCLTAVMALAGLILLLPGLCTLILGGMTRGTAIPDWAMGTFVIAIGGFLLICSAFRGPRR